MPSGEFVGPSLLLAAELKVTKRVLRDSRGRRPVPPCVHPFPALGPCRLPPSPLSLPSRPADSIQPGLVHRADPLASGAPQPETHPPAPRPCWLLGILRSGRDEPGFQASLGRGASCEAGERFCSALGPASPGEASPNCSACLAKGSGPALLWEEGGQVCSRPASAAKSTCQPRLSLWAWRGPTRPRLGLERRKPGHARPGPAVGSVPCGRGQDTRV